MSPRSGNSRNSRQRKSCAASVAVGVLKETTLQPCGLTPDMTWAIAPSLPAGVHALQHDQQREAAGAVEMFLQLAELRDVLGEARGVILFRVVKRLDPGRTLGEVRRLALGTR